MGLDDLELLLGQAAGFVQDLLVDGDLANVVQGCSQRDIILHFGGDVVAVGPFQQLFQHPFGQALDVLDMQPALAVAELDHLAQNAHQHGGVLLPLTDLLRQQSDQPPLFCVQFNGIEHPAVDHAGVERAGDVIRNAHFVGTADGGFAVLAGDHDNGQVLNGVVAVHEVQHLEAVHLGHHEIQQHQGDIPHVLMQLFKALLAVGSFQNAVVPPQDLRKDGAVHLGIVHDEHLLLLFPLGVCFIGQVLRTGHHHAVFAELGLIHQPVGLTHHGIHRAAGHLDDAAYAGRKPHMAVAGHDGIVELFADLLQLDFEVLLRDAGQHQQKFVAAEAHQCIGLADAAPHDVDGGLQRHITGMVAVGIVVDLEVIQIHQRHAGGALHPPDDLLIVAAIEHIGQGIVVKLGVVAGDRAEQGLGVVRVNDGIAVHPLQQFQHEGIPVHFQISGRHLYDIRCKVFQFYTLIVVLIGAFHGTVAAAAALVAAGIAQIVAVGVGAHSLFDPCNGVLVQQPHIGVQLL